MATAAANKRKFDAILRKSERIAKKVAELSKEVGKVTVPDFLYRISEDKLPDEDWLKELMDSPLISRTEKELAHGILSNIEMRKGHSQR